MDTPSLVARLMMFASGRERQNNDDLIDDMHIESNLVEKAFRAVDRADYVLASHRNSAYKDFPWGQGDILLSAPSVYCEVVEKLCLQPGQSFLNIGSGTGYLNTVAGLLLTHRGINHGIELKENCIKYAYERLEQFMKTSPALDEFDFCEPRFVQGNCLNVIQDRQYDRVYCGAECPEMSHAFIEQFVCIGGILVMPVQNFLKQYIRLNEKSFLMYDILPVSFTPLVVPISSIEPYIRLPNCNRLSLMELCRGTIRKRLLENIWRQNGDNLVFKKVQVTRVNRDAISSHMKESIRRLPLPFKLKMEIQRSWKNFTAPAT
ncbi:protein-L-isoaspartate O-methyltransferase domain-containing protein 1 isoform X2 [Halictus rubicundus]|uniref:protein-L-isoaspartate O-methyltransferase domain-containing protein 1 isoform X2 n=1 Tax=Halictus rubicundus TaxID=77578 RepID=UPI004036BC9A